MSFLLALEGLARGQAKVTYGQVAVAFLMGAMFGCAWFTIVTAPPVIGPWWGPFAALLYPLPWFAGMLGMSKAIRWFHSPFVMVEAYRTRNMKEAGR